MKNRLKGIAISSLLSVFALNCSFSQVGPTDNIRLNQIGFYSDGSKTAVVVNPPSDRFYVVSTTNKDTVFSGFLKKAGTWEFSQENVSKADFTRFSKPGSYMLSVPGVGQSYPFEIGDKVHLPVGKAALKMFYFQRASTDLPEKHAGKWARKAGHPDNEVLVHPSAATAKRPSNIKISSPRGWYDAGDYNKYIVNSGISTYTVLAMYENFPKFFDTLQVNIPESSNNIPDVLDEALWNLRWMLTMQDEDGGVYHKLTNPNFDGVIMPEAAKEPRYVVKKGTAATLDFAAVMAQAARIFKKYDKQLPGLSDSCLTSAKKAWKWSKKNPNVLYKQNEINSSFNPDIITGEYPDQVVDDEFQWAAMELYATTGDEDFYEDAMLEYTLNNAFDIPGWQKVNTLGLYTLARMNNAPTVENREAIRDKVLGMANALKKYAKNSEFGVPMGQNSNNFDWGSNSFAANQGMLLLIAYNITYDKDYLETAIDALDYLLGRNGTGYSYVTGFGDKASKDPHHRISESDGIEGAIPGMLVGGPNPKQEDLSNCGNKYPSSLPAKSYIDHHCSYASNEVTINWNAPLAFLTLGIEAIKGPSKSNVAKDNHK